LKLKQRAARKRKKGHLVEPLQNLINGGRGIRIVLALPLKNKTQAKLTKPNVMASDNPQNVLEYEQLSVVFFA
jgi:hypothetical protein